MPQKLGLGIDYIKYFFRRINSLSPAVLLPPPVGEAALPVLAELGHLLVHLVQAARRKLEILLRCPVSRHDVVTALHGDRFKHCQIRSVVPTHQGATVRILVVVRPEAVTNLVSQSHDGVVFA